MDPSHPTKTAYRDEKFTLASRLEKLHIELERVRQARSTIELLTARETELLAEIALLTAEMKNFRTQRSLPLLNLAYVASPCSADWNKMRGNDRTRFCEDCGKNVHNISAMSVDDAETFLRSLTGDACVRMYRRKDGTVLTQDCPVGVRRKKRKRAVGVLVGTGMAVAGFATAQADSDDLANVLKFGHTLRVDLIDDTPVAVAGGMMAEPYYDPPPPEPFEKNNGLAGATGGQKDLPIPWTNQMERPTLVAGPSTPVNPNGVEGLILARCTITKNGTLRDCNVIAGPQSMKQQTLDMLSRQRYTPVFYQGKPVNVTYTLRFKLERSPSARSPAPIGSPPSPDVQTEIKDPVYF